MITFAICNSQSYDSNSKSYMENLLESIEREKIPGVEIISVGDYALPKHIKEPGTISKQLNLGVEAASNEVVVLLRDYMTLYPGFWKGFQRFGFDWDLAMCVIMNRDLTRFRDWVVWIGDDAYPHEDWIQKERWTKAFGEVVKGRPYLPCYDYTDIRRMYISGGLFIGKRDFFLKHKFNEDLDLGQAEDVEWFNRIRFTDFSYRMNRFSAIKLQKQKDPVFKPLHAHFGSFEYISEKLETVLDSEGRI